MINITVTIPDAARSVLTDLQSLRRPVAEGAAIGVERCLRDWFAELQRRPRQDGLKPSGFWSGADGNDVAGQIADPVINDDGTGEVVITSPALAHKLSGGTIKAADYGHPYLTLPANDEAVSAPQGARSFQTRIAWVEHPDGGLRPALVAAANYARETKHRDGTRSRKGTRNAAKANVGMDDVLFWLVKSVTHRPMPDALPTQASLDEAAKSAALDVIDALLGGAAS